MPTKYYNPSNEIPEVSVEDPSDTTSARLVEALLANGYRELTDTGTSLANDEFSVVRATVSPVVEDDQVIRYVRSYSSVPFPVNFSCTGLLQMLKDRYEASGGQGNFPPDGTTRLTTFLATNTYRRGSPDAVAAINEVGISPADFESMVLQCRI